MFERVEYQGQSDKSREIDIGLTGARLLRNLLKNQSINQILTSQCKSRFKLSTSAPLRTPRQMYFLNSSLTIMRLLACLHCSFSPSDSTGSINGVGVKDHDYEPYWKVNLSYIYPQLAWAHTVLSCLSEWLDWHCHLWLQVLVVGLNYRPNLFISRGLWHNGGLFSDQESVEVSCKWI